MSLLHEYSGAVRKLHAIRAGSSLVTKLHLANALFFGAFLILHIANHLAALHGPEAHMLVMGMLRTVYRSVAIEPLIFASGLFQIGSGLTLAVRLLRRWRHMGYWQRLQAGSGLYIAFFLLQHFVALVRARTQFPDVDTNFFWAASVVHLPPLKFYFIPYYALGVTAIFAHLASALVLAGHDLQAPRTAKRLGWITMIAGVSVSLLIVASLAGAFYPITLSPAYHQYLAAFGVH